MNSDLVDKVVCLAKKKIKDFLENDDCSDKEEVTLYYSGSDFKRQDYTLNDSKDLYLGNFKVPLSDEKGRHIGWLKWDSSAVPPEAPEDEWSVLEHMTMSLGTTHNHPVWFGAALSRAKNGFYNLNRAYKFYVIGSEGKANVTIKKIDDTLREVKISGGALGGGGLNEI